MMKEIISSHDGISIFGIVSLLLFFFAFGIASIRAWGMSDTYAKQMASLVVDENNSDVEQED